MILEEHRKVVQVGGGKAVILPALFCKKHKIKLGDEILLLADKMMVVVPKSQMDWFEAHRGLIEDALGGV